MGMRQECLPQQAYRPTPATLEHSLERRRAADKWGL